MILNNIGQGFLTVDLAGRMSDERSSVVSEWFGPSSENQTFADYLRPVDASVAEYFELGMESLQEDILPTEVALDQLPKRVVVGTDILEFKYKTIENEAHRVEKVLVIMTDITSDIEREHAEAQQKQLMDVFGHIMRDKLGFLEFLSEADSLVDAVIEHRYEDLPQLKRILHTIKGNAGLFGMTSVSSLCHQLEDEIILEGVIPEEHQLAALRDEWDRVRDHLDQLLGKQLDKNIEIDDADYEAVLHSLLNKEKPEKIAKMVQSWRLETTKHRLNFIKQQTEGLALRLGKKDIHIQIKPHNLRMENEHWAPFWSSFVHILRNAVDHGIETEEERARLGKTGSGIISLETYVENHYCPVK